jgi:1,2-phenylacetyl-CoA epoxidase PaaB subunit
MTIRTGKARPGGQAAGPAAARYYEVFARRDLAEALTHLGSVEAPNDELAQVRAWYIYDQHAWREMCVVPTSAIVPVDPAGRRTAIGAV